MRWLVLTTMVLFAATCGQKGPLTRPTPTASPSALLAQVASRRCPTTVQLCSTLAPLRAVADHG